MYKSGLYVYSPADGKLTAVTEDYNILIKDVRLFNDRIYFRKDTVKYTLKQEEPGYDEIYPSHYYAEDIIDSVYYSAAADGSDLHEDELFKNAETGAGVSDKFDIDGEYMIFFDSDKRELCRMNIYKGEKEVIFSEKEETRIRWEIKSGYIYITEYIKKDKYNIYDDSAVYYCIKTDGTLVEKSDKSFDEWYY